MNKRYKDKFLYTVSRLIVVFGLVFLLARIKLGFMGTFIVRTPLSILLILLLYSTLEKKKWFVPGKRLAISGILRYFVGGSIAGLSLYGLVFLMQWIFGIVSFQGYLWQSRENWNNILLGITIINLGVAFWEELVFRGYLLQVLQDKFNQVNAILISSLFFAALHFIFTTDHLLVILNITLLSIILSILTPKYKTIWPAVGLHFAWNWLQSSVGIIQFSNEHIVFFEKTTGMPWYLTGTVNYQGEATIFATIISLVVILFFSYQYFVKKNKYYIVKDNKSLKG